MAVKIWGLVRKVRDQLLLGNNPQMRRAAPCSQDFPQDPGPARDPPCTPFIKRGVGGDFRKGLAKPDFLANFKLSSLRILTSGFWLIAYLLIRWTLPGFKTG
jgi:hypothetical protein